MIRVRDPEHGSRAGWRFFLVVSCMILRISMLRQPKEEWRELIIFPAKGKCVLVEMYMDISSAF